MKHITIPVHIPTDIMIALNESEQELKTHIQVVVAIMLFQEGKLTMGKAIQLSGLSRYEFEKELAKRKIDIAEIDPAQVFSDVEKLREL